MRNREGQRSRDLSALGPGAAAPDQPLSPSAQQTLDLVRGQAHPTDLADLADLAGRHSNTVREHLAVLVGAGLVIRERATPAGRGRPAWRYSARPRRPEVVEYAELAGALSSVIARTSPDPAADALRAGATWGRDRARRRGAATCRPETARERAVELLEDLGFAPRQDDSRDPSQVRLTRCPLLDAARQDPGIVCAVHHGLLRGVLEAHGADPAGSRLVPFAEPGSCLLVVPPLPDTATPPA